MTQNDKKFLSWLISQEPYIIWLSFMLHICKLISSGVFFFNFSKFWFSGSVKMTKNCVCLILFLRNCTSYNCDFWCTFLKWWYLQQSFSFFKILIFWVFRGVKGQKNNYLFFKFISKCQKINSEVCPAFFTFVFFLL